MLALHAEFKKDARQSAARVNDFLGKLLTLTAALVGGGLVLARGDVMPVWSSVLVIVALSASAAFCLHGLRPYRILIGGDLGDETAQVVDYLNRLEASLALKERALKRAVIAFVVATAIGLGGMVFQVFYYPSGHGTIPAPTTAKR